MPKLQLARQQPGNTEISVEKQCEEKTEISIIPPNCKLGDIVQFGNSQWIVLSKTFPSKVLLLKKTAICARQFNKPEDGKKTDWAFCNLRNWLNEEYYKTAFSSSEQELIQETHVLGPVTSYGSWDRIFILSSTEFSNLIFNKSDIAICISEGKKSSLVVAV